MFENFSPTKDQNKILSFSKKSNNFFISFSMGEGSSFGIVSLMVSKKNEKSLLVCPNSMVNYYLQFLPIHFPEARIGEVNTDSQIEIVSSSSLSKVESEYSLVAFDNLFEFKNLNSKKRKEAKKISLKAKTVVGILNKSYLGQIIKNKKEFFSILDLIKDGVAGYPFDIIEDVLVDNNQFLSFLDSRKIAIFS